MEIIAKKNKEIEILKEINSKQEQKIAELSAKPEKTKPDKVIETSKPKILPTLHQRIRFQEAGKNNVLAGKVIYKHKPKSVHKNIIVIKFDDGHKKRV